MGWIVGGSDSRWVGWGDHFPPVRGPRCSEDPPPPRSDYYRCVRAHSSRIIRCGYVGLTLCGAGPFYSLDSTRGDGINRSLSRSLRHRLIQTDLRDGRDAGEWGYGEQIGYRE